MSLNNAMNVKIIQNEHKSLQYEVEMPEEYLNSLNLQFSSFCLLLPKNEIETNENDVIEDKINENKFILSKLTVFYVCLYYRSKIKIN